MSLAVGEREWGVVLTIARHRQRKMMMRRSQVQEDHARGQGPCPPVHTTHVQGVSHTQDHEAVVEVGTKGLLADDEVGHIQDQEVVPGLDLVKSIDVGEVIVMIQGVGGRSLRSTHRSKVGKRGIIIIAREI